jgi:hypothetical protein
LSENWNPLKSVHLFIGPELFPIKPD